MGDEEGTGNCESGGRGVFLLRHVKQHLKCQAESNGFDVASGNDSDDGSSRYRENYRFYKRRTSARSSSEKKGLEDGVCSAEAASKAVDQTAKELPSRLYGNHSTPHGMNEVSSIQWRSFLLKHMYLSIYGEGGIGKCIFDALKTNNDEGGIGDCISDAPKAKGSDFCDGGRHKSSLETGFTGNGTQAATKEEMGAKPNEFLDDSLHKVNEMCRHSLLKVLQSQDFTSLCKLIFENFQGVNADNLFGLKLIDKRMKEGIYGRSPMLFSADVQQLWLKLQKVGTELMSLAKSLADMSMSCYSEQFGGAVNCASEVGKDEFGTRESISHGKSEQTESHVYGVSTCRTCGDKADGRDCLVCDACEDMYHLSCIKPAVKEIPSKSWFCATCAGARPHIDCDVCETLTPPSTHFQQLGDEINPADEETVSEPEQIMNDSTADGAQVSQRNENLGDCKICASLVKNGKCKICEHPFCPSKYYHERCLTPRQRCRFGPKWYCPSCLCRVCRKDKDDDMIVLCDSCDHAYHIYCTDPVLTSIPEGKWFCNRCNLKIQEILKAKSVHQKREKMKRKHEEAKMVNDNPVKKPRSKAMDSEKNKDGMNMLAIAALKCEVGSSSNEELKGM